MATLAQLHQAVQAALAAKRIGQPVFVRCHLQGILEGASIRASLAKVALMVGDWIGEPAHKLFSLSSDRDGKGQTTLLLRYPGGASALVSEGHGSSRGSGVNLMMLGNWGALYHSLDAATLHHWDR